jgi:predicted small integral membrane protein
MSETSFAWMAWTPQTAIFFAFIAVSLIILTLLAIWRPETPRKGILGFPTTRGDRFFVSLLGSAFIFILWIRLGGGELWYALAICIPFAVAMFRFA